MILIRYYNYIDGVYIKLLLERKLVGFQDWIDWIISLQLDYEIC